MVAEAGMGAAALLTITLIGAVLVVVYTIRLGVPPWPSCGQTRRALLTALPEHVHGDIFELGCGWGGLALDLAERYPERRVVGVDLSPVPWTVARLRVMAGRADNLEIRRANLHRVDLSQAGLVVCYLNRTAMTRLAARLGAEAPPGCLIVSNTFGLGDWTPEARVPTGDLFGSTVLIYRVPHAI